MELLLVTLAEELGGRSGAAQLPAASAQGSSEARHTARSSVPPVTPPLAPWALKLLVPL